MYPFELSGNHNMTIEAPLMLLVLCVPCVANREQESVYWCYICLAGHGVCIVTLQLRPEREKESAYIYIYIYIYHRVQTSSGAHLASYPMGTRGSLIPNFLKIRSVVLEVKHTIGRTNRHDFLCVCMCVYSFMYSMQRSHKNKTYHHIHLTLTEITLSLVVAFPPGDIYKQSEPRCKGLKSNIKSLTALKMVFVIATAQNILLFIVSVQICTYSFSQYKGTVGLVGTSLYKH
jgi:hypothetical protein